MARLAGAVGELGARLGDVDADLLGIDLTGPEQKCDGGNVLMRTVHRDFDVLAVDQTARAPCSYEQLRARPIAVAVLGARILIAHPENLIRMKTTASRSRDRPKLKRRYDLDDMAVLERLRAQPGCGDINASQRATTGPLPVSAPLNRNDRRRAESAGESWSTPLGSRAPEAPADSKWFAAT